MSLAVKFTDLPLGAEIDGIDLSRELEGDAFGTIKRVLDERSVVVLRGQRIAPDRMVRFAKRFGKLLIHAQVKTLVPNNPELMIVSNIIENGKNIGIKDAGKLWHTDGSYLSHPDMYTFLYGIEIPEQNGKALGNTLYSDAVAAYDALPGAMKTKLDNLKAVHSFEYHARHRAQLKGGMHIELTDELRKKHPDIEQPVVRTHPVTGRKALYVTEGHTTHIVGLPADESKSLLQELTQHIYRPEFIYSHNWRVGDLVIWDNAATQHRATFDYALPLRRLMHRTATEGMPAF